MSTVLAIASALAMAMVTTAWGSDDAQRPLKEAVEGAIEAWAEFATTGSLSAVKTSFALDGPQFRQFEIEANDGGAKPDVGALEMEIFDLRPRLQDSTTATVWTRLQVSRIGFVPEVVSWDFDLINDGGGWLVWTVIPATTPPSDVTMAEPSSTTRPASPTTTLAAPRATQEPTVVRVPSPDPTVNATASAVAESSRGVRIPAVSAWIIVITLVGVAVAGYMAPRIDRRQD